MTEYKQKLELCQKKLPLYAHKEDPEAQRKTQRNYIPTRSH